MNITMEKPRTESNNENAEISPAEQIQAIASEHMLSDDEASQFASLAVRVELDGIDAVLDSLSNVESNKKIKGALEQYSIVAEHSKGETEHQNSVEGEAAPQGEISELATKENLDLRAEYDTLALFILQSDLGMEDKMRAIQGFSAQLRDVVTEFGGFSFDNVKTALSNLSTDAEMPIQREFANKVWDFVRSHSNTMSQMNEEELQQFMMSSLG